MSTVVEIEAAIGRLPLEEQAKLCDQLFVRTSRVTNVDPLPDRVARHLYSQTDDDADAIRLLMAAQVNCVEE